MAEADGGAEGMDDFSGACRRGRLGEEADSVMDRTGAMKNTLC